MRCHRELPYWEKNADKPKIPIPLLEDVEFAMEISPRCAMISICHQLPGRAGMDVGDRGPQKQ